MRQIDIVVMDLRESCISLVRYVLIIIHLLYPIACVAVGNLPEFLHKRNPSSCLAAIVN